MIEYQVIVNLAAEAVKYALPIGLVFGVAEKVCNLWFSMALGAKNIRM